jgi:DNA-binding GntR family transcriptional regulator
MKTNTVYKRAYNRCLDLVADRVIGNDIGSENELSGELGVSRTTVRVILESLHKAGLIDIDARSKIIKRYPSDDDYFPDIETVSVSASVEKKFMSWILQGDCKPGQPIYALELARQFHVSTSAIREHLNRFNHFGLIRRRQNGGWVFRGFTLEFAIELSEVREMFELRSAQRFVELDAKSPAWQKLDQLERQHLALMKDIDDRYRDFSALDERLHRLINDVSRNRFIENFYTIISMIFHYHYQWSKTDEKNRNLAAIQEHLAYISALKSRDLEAATITCRAHMKTSRLTLLKSLAPVHEDGPEPRLRKQHDNKHIYR